MHLSTQQLVTVDMSSAEPAMGPKDLIWLGLLGLSAQRPSRDEDALVSAFILLTAQLWSPSPALVHDCVAEMVRGGLLFDAPDGGVGITPDGRQILSRLMHLRGGQPGSPWGQLTLRVQLAFADQLVAGRSSFLHRLVEEFEASLNAHAVALPLAGDLATQWAERERHQLQTILNDLRTVAKAHCNGDCRNCPCGGAGKTEH